MDKRVLFLCFSFCVFSLLYFFFCMWSFFLPPFFSQPACRCLQTTWRLTVICSRFPKPTIWAKKKLTGLRSHVPVHDTTAAIHQGGAGMVSNTPTMIMMNLPRTTCGLRMNMAMVGDTLPVITDTMEVRVDIQLRPVIQMSQGHQGHPRVIPKIHQCAMILQDDPPRAGVVSQDLEGITLQNTHGIHLVTTTASGPLDRGTHTAPHAASPSSPWTCRVNQVHL